MTLFISCVEQCGENEVANLSLSVFLSPTLFLYLKPLKTSTVGFMPKIN